MSFAHPILLTAGLAAVALPILIHILFRRRRRPQAWAAMRFLEAAYRSQRQRLRLEQILLLAARCLIVLLVALALAGPLLGGQHAGGGSRDLYLVIDNAIASATQTGGRTAFSRSIETAQRLIDEADPASGDAFAVVPLAGGTPLAPTSSQTAATAALEALEATDAAPDWPAAAATIDRLARDRENDRSAVIVLLSAFREGSAPVDTALPPILGSAATPPRIVARAPAGSALPNIAVESLTPTRQLVLTSGAEAEPLAVVARLRRSDASAREEASTLLSLYADLPDQPGRDAVAAATLNWSPGERQAAATLLIAQPDRVFGAERLVTLRLEARAGDALDRDNTARAVVRTAPQVRVGVVARPRFAAAGTVEAFDAADWVTAALRPRPAGRAAIDVVPIDPAALDASITADIDTLFILSPGELRDEAWPALAAFARSGGTVAIFPDARDAVHTWPDNLARIADAAAPIGVAREPVAHDPEQLLREPQPSQSPLLAFVSGELEFLLEPVRISQSLPITTEPAGSERTVLSLDDGRPWLVELPIGTGRLLLAASAIDTNWTNLPAKPAFVPIVQEIARRGARGQIPSELSVAGQPLAPVPSALTLDAVGPTRGVRTIDLRGETDQSPTPAHAAARLARDERGRVVGLTIIEPALPAASLDPTPRAQLETWLQTWAGEDGVVLLEEDEIDADSAVRRAIASTGLPRGLGWPLLVAAGIIAVLESILSRLLTRRRAAPPARRPA